MRKRRTKVGAVMAAVAAGGMLAAVTPASPAVAFFSSPLLLDIRVQSPATLVARGAGLSVPLELTCSGTGFASVNVSVSQRVGSETATGFGFVDVPCTGQRLTILLSVQAQGGSKAFRKGTAFAQAEIFGCTDTFCGSERDSRTISVVR